MTKLEVCRKPPMWALPVLLYCPVTAFRDGTDQNKIVQKGPCLHFEVRNLQ